MARHWGPETEADLRRPARSAAPSAGGESDVDTAEVRPIIPAARRPSTPRRPSTDPGGTQAATA